MNELKPLHQDNTVEVPRRVWNQLESKLNNNKQKKKLLRMKVISGVAACLIAAFGLSYLSVGISGDKGSFASNGNYKSMVFEDLEKEESSLYDFNQVAKLKSVILNSHPSFAKRHR